jgi:predicted phage tail protein
MITVKRIPNILNKDGREEKIFDCLPGKTIEQYLADSGFHYKDQKIVLSGKRITDLSMVPESQEEELLVLPDNKIEIIIFAAVASWMATALVIAAVVTAIATVAFAIWQMCQKPKKPSYGAMGGAGSSSMDESSPTYSWNPMQATMDVGTPIPVVYGTHRVAPNMICSYLSETDADGEGSGKQYLNNLYCFGEGEIDSFSDYEINENPSTNYDGVDIETRLGTNDQTVIPNFNDAPTLYDVGATLIKEDPYTYTTIKDDVEAFEVHIEFPLGFYEATSGGGTQSISCQFKIEHKLHSSGTWIVDGTPTYNGNTRSTARRIFRKEGLSAGQYDIRVTRLTNDGTSTLINDSKLERISEINTDDFCYPNCALVGLKFLATDQLSGATPNFTAIVKGKKIMCPQVMNGATAVDWEDYYWDDDDECYRLISDDTELTWDGETYHTAYCANPVWCVYDLLVSTRYGLGRYIEAENIALAEFVEESKYCEELVPDGDGGYEKRFELNIVMDSQTSSLDCLIQICATFRAWAFYSNGTIILKIDKPESPSQMFNSGNIAEKTFQMHWKSLKEVPNFIEVEYNDANKNYQREKIASIDEASLTAGNPPRKKDVRLFVTKLSRAVREGRYARLIAKYIHRTVTFKAGIDAIACMAGDVITINHSLPQWGVASGRVAAGSTPTTVKLTEPVTLAEGSTYKIRIRLTGDSVEEKTITNEAGTTDTITISGTFSSAPQQFDIYDIGTSSNIKKDFRVVELKKEGTNEVEITAVEYNSLCYDDSDIDLPDFLDLDPATGIPLVTNLTLTERTLLLPDGSLDQAIEVWFNRPNQANYSFKKYQKAKIYLSDDAGTSWTLIGETEGEYFEIQGGLVVGTTYTVAVVSVSYAGDETAVSASPDEDITLAGKVLPPADVTNFSASFGVDHVRFAWTRVTDGDLAGYEIREGDSWSMGTVIAAGITTTAYDLFLITAGTHRYMIKAVDTSGNYSVNEAISSVTISGVPAQNVILRLEDQFAGAVSGDIEIGYTKDYNTGYYRKALILKTANTWPITSWPVQFGQPFSSNSGAYYTSPVVDLGRIFSAILTLDLGTFNVSGGILSVQIAYSETDSDPTDYVDFAPGQYSCRYIRFKIIMSTADIAQALRVYKIKLNVDVPDITQRGTNVAIDSAGTTITLEGFYQITSIGVSVVGTTPLVPHITAQSSSSFTVKLYNPATAAYVSGYINYDVAGY